MNLTLFREYCSFFYSGMCEFLKLSTELLQILQKLFKKFPEECGIKTVLVSLSTMLPVTGRFPKYQVPT